MRIDNKPNGFHLTGSMGVWDQLPGTAQAQKGSVVGSWWGGRSGPGFILHANRVRRTEPAFSSATFLLCFLRQVRNFSEHIPSPQNRKKTKLKDFVQFCFV